MTSIASPILAAADAWRPKWRLYLIEAALLGSFMISACIFVFLLAHPSSPISSSITTPMLRQALIGVAMGLTAIALIYSPWGKQSGALMNPAMTAGFVRLRRLDPRDALGYIAGQFIGAAAGVAVMTTLRGMWIGHPSVNYVATIPGRFGVVAAWSAEFVISFFLVFIVMAINKIPRLAPFSGCFAGLLVAIYITFESPISGMSMNPARTFGSALLGRVWTGWWIYLTAPVIGMLAAVEVHARLARHPHLLCVRLSHSRTVGGIFHCNCLDRVASNTAS
jgi:aquaporin Z